MKQKKIWSLLALSFMLCALSTDTAGQSRKLEWVISDIDMVKMIIRELEPQLEGDQMQFKLGPNDDVLVEARIEPAGPSLTRLFRRAGKIEIFPNARNGASTTLSDELTQAVLRREYSWRNITSVHGEEISTDGRKDSTLRWISSVHWWSPKSLELLAPESVHLRAPGSKFGLFARLGDPDLGLPGPATTSMSFGAMYDNVKLYATLPVVQMLDTRLEGAVGGGIAYESDFFGSRFQYGDLTQRVAGEFQDTANINYMSTALQFYFITDINPFTDVYMKVKVGAIGYMVSNAISPDGDALEFVDRELIAGGWLRFEWASLLSGRDFARFEGSLQAIVGNHSSLTLMLGYNLTPNIGLRATTTATLVSEEREDWALPFMGWGGILFRF